MAGKKELFVSMADIKHMAASAEGKELLDAYPSDAGAYLARYRISVKGEHPKVTKTYLLLDGGKEHIVLHCHLNDPNNAYLVKVLDGFSLEKFLERFKSESRRVSEETGLPYSIVTALDPSFAAEFYTKAQECVGPKNRFDHAESIMIVLGLSDDTALGKRVSELRGGSLRSVCDYLNQLAKEKRKGEWT